MAIAYLVNIDLNNNQLLDFKVYNRTSDETGLSGAGQLIYRTDTNVLKYHTGSNTWVTVGTSNDSWILNGDSGTVQTINNDNTVLFSGGTYITTVVSATDTLTINHDATPRTDTTSTATPAHGTAFTVIDSITTNATGHVTAANLKLVTLPNDNETYTLPVSSGAANTAAIELTAGGTGSGVKSNVTFIGTGSGIAITKNAVNNGSITIALQDNIDIAGTLDVTGITTLDANLIVAGSGLSTFVGQVQVPTANADTNAPNLGQVKLLVAGVGVYQGPYDASTNTPALSGASNVALNLGDYFVVSVAGNNGGYFGDLEPGNFIFADADIAAASSPAVSEYTVVRADDNIAGAGATDGATQKGVSGFDSGSFAATANGWITLKNRSVAGTYGTASAVSTITTDAKGIVTAASETIIEITASQVSDFCAAVQTCVADNGAAVLIGDGTATSYAIDVSALSLPTGTRDLMVQTFRNSTPWDTVYLDVERTSNVLLTLTTTTALAANSVRVLIQKIT